MGPSAWVLLSDSEGGLADVVGLAMPRRGWRVRQRVRKCRGARQGPCRCRPRALAEVNPLLMEPHTSSPESRHVHCARPPRPADLPLAQT